MSHMLTIVIRIIITVYGCLKPSVSLKHMPRLILEKIREGKIYASSMSYFGEALLSTGCWVDLLEGCWLQNALACGVGARLLELRKYWNIQGEEKESMRTKMANFQVLGPWLILFWHFSGLMGSGVSGWSNSVRQSHPGTGYMLLVHLVDRHGGKTSAEAVWGCF